MVDGHFSKDAELRKEKRDLGKLRQLTATAQSRPIIERLHQALSRIKLSRYHLSKSAFGRALDYALTLWPILEVYMCGDRQQLGGKRDPSQCRRQKELAVHRRCRCWLAQCHPLHDHRILSRPWPGSLGIFERCAHPPADHDQPTAQRHHACSLGRGPKAETTSRVALGTPPSTRFTRCLA